MEGSNYWGIRLQDSAFLSEVAVNHLKKARGEIWPKRSEKKHKKIDYQDDDKINKKQLILRLRSLISKRIPNKDN